MRLRKPRHVTLEITLKSGAKVTVHVATWKFSKGPFGNVLEWTTPDNPKRRLVRVDLDEVAAIVEVP